MFNAEVFFAYIYAHINVKLVVSYFYNKKANILEFFLSWKKNIAKICHD